MIDQMNHNSLGVTGTPSLVTGALTVDSDQALQFNGTTNSAAAADSASLSITGSLSIEMFVKLAAYPGSAQHIVNKTNSYAVQVDTTGHIHFLVSGGSFVDVASNVALSLNTWYHIVCVYNGNYAGVQQFGKTTLGASNAQVDDDNGNNKNVSSYSLAETALLKTLNVALYYVDEIWDVQMRAVVYADNGGVPGSLVTQSDVRLLRPPTPDWRVWTWVPFTLQPAVVPAGTYYLGYISDTVSGSLPKAPLIVSCNDSGGYRVARPDSVGSASDPFGAPNLTDARQSSVYCDYAAVGRTGREGKALIYINGALNSSAVYSAGVTDTTNTLQVCAAIAAQVDELSIWNKALSDVQIATHYNAH